MKEIASATGISKDNLYKWANGTKPTDIREYRKLEAYLDENEVLYDIVREPKLPYIPPKSTFLYKISILLNTDEEPKPYSGEPPAGSIVNIKGKQAFIAYQPDSITHGKAEGVIRITFSLAPKYNSNKEGMWIGLRRLKPEEAINASHYYYVIDRDSKVYITKYFPSGQKGSVWLTPLNEKVEPFIRDRKEIRAFFKIEWFQENFASGDD